MISGGVFILKSIILFAYKASFLLNSSFISSFTKKSFFVIQNIIFILGEPKYVIHLHQIIETQIIQYNV